MSEIGFLKWVESFFHGLEFVYWNDWKQFSKRGKSIPKMNEIVFLNWVKSFFKWQKSIYWNGWNPFFENEWIPFLKWNKTILWNEWLGVWKCVKLLKSLFEIVEKCNVFENSDIFILKMSEISYLKWVNIFFLLNLVKSVCWN